MIYLGQSMLYQTYNDPKKPCIFIGSTDEYNPTWFVVNEAGETIKIYSLKNLFYIHKEDKLSPTGRAVYYGSLKRDIMGPFKLKVPEKEALEKEFAAIKNL